MRNEITKNNKKERRELLKKLLKELKEMEKKELKQMKKNQAKEIKKYYKKVSKVLKRLLKNEELFFSQEWFYAGLIFNADFKIQVREGNEKQVQITIDQIKDGSATCVFNEEYNLVEIEQFKRDLEDESLEFVIDKLVYCD